MVGDRPIDIEVDGGIGGETSGKAAAAGANAFVAGSSIFKGGRDAYRANIEAIRAGASESARLNGRAACAPGLPGPARDGPTN